MRHDITFWYRLAMHILMYLSPSFACSSAPCQCYPDCQEKNQSIHETANVLLLNNTLLFLISADAEVIVCEILTLHLLQELFVMSNDNELEIGLSLALFNDHVERFCQRLDRVSVKVCCRFIESNNLNGVRTFSIGYQGMAWGLTPQFAPKHSARANRIMILAKTFCPALQRPRISISVSCLTITT